MFSAEMHMQLVLCPKAGDCLSMYSTGYIVGLLTFML